jgi:hypothetical protein
MIPGLAAAMLCAGAVAADATLPDLATTNGIESLILGLVDGNRFPYVVGQMDLYIASADLEGPLRMSIWPEIPGQRKVWVEIVDMAKPSWDVAFEMARAGVDYEHVSAELETMKVSVDGGTCPRLEPAVASLRGAFIESVARFAATPPAGVMFNGQTHQRLVEVRMVGPGFEIVSINRQYPGPPALMRQLDDVAQLAAGCTGKPVRRMVFATEPSSASH